MGIFFRSETFAPSVVGDAIEDALKTSPSAVTNPKQEATIRANRVAQQISGEFSWARFSLAIVLLVVILGVGIYSAQHNLNEWSKVLVHSFELVLGLVLGLLGGEAAAHS